MEIKDEKNSSFKNKDIKKNIYSAEVGQIIKNKTLESKIDALLTNLGGMDYKQVVLNTYKSIGKNSNGRCSEINKIKAIVYQTLKKKGVPVLLRDFSEENTTKTRILKFIYKNFKHCEVSRDYILNLQERIVGHLVTNGFKVENKLSTEKIDQIRRGVLHGENILAFFLSDKFCVPLFNKYDISYFCSYKSLWRVVNKNRENF